MNEYISERIVTLHIERLPEGFFLATSDDVPGLVAQGRTISETLEIAKDVARKLMEAYAERRLELPLRRPGEAFDHPLVVGGI